MWCCPTGGGAFGHEGWVSVCLCACGGGGTLPPPSPSIFDKKLKRSSRPLRGGCKRTGALAHAPPRKAFSHNVHAVSSIPVFPPYHDFDPAILPLLGLWPGSTLSSAIHMAVADPDAPRPRGAAEASCLEGASDKAAVVGGALCSTHPILASPFL